MRADDIELPHDYRGSRKHARFYLGASLYEYLKFYERVQLILVSDFTEFRTSCDTRYAHRVTLHKAQLFSYPELAVSVRRVYRKIPEPI